MGNNNSSENTRREYKIYKIISKEKHSDWFRCYLDGCVPYNDGNYMYMNFEENSTTYNVLCLVSAVGGAPPVPEDAILEEGYYIAVNTSATRESGSNRKFTKRNVKTVGVERVDSNGNLNFVEFIGGIGQVINEARERSAFMTQQARQQDQFYAWHLEPPKK